MDHERIDFSSLDPSRDELTWTRSIDALVTRALADRHKRLSVEEQLLRWARPVLAVAAGLCIVAWTAGYFSPSTKMASSAQRSAAITLASWAANNQIPEPSDVLGLLENHP
jgi:hypothetical protein